MTPEKSNPPSKPLRKIDERIEWIERKAAAMYPNQKILPRTVRAIIKAEALKEKGLFTDSTFEKAWQSAGVSVDVSIKLD